MMHQEEGSRQGGGNHDDDIENDVHDEFELQMTEEELREWEESNAAGMVMGGRQ